MSPKQRKWYVVWEGYRPGVYDNWQDCQLQVVGFQGAKFKSYPTSEQAQEAFELGYHEGRQLGQQHRVAKPESNRLQVQHSVEQAPDQLIGDKIAPAGFINHSIAVDGACSSNPGVTEYRGVYTFSHAELFRAVIPWGTNNIGEYLAIVHALALMEQGKLPPLPIYSDSKVALGWVAQARCRTRLDSTDPRSAKTYELIVRATHWLKTHTFRVPLLKWDTVAWGEIPADFGRK